MTQQVPRTLMGRYPTVAMTNLQTFAIRAGAYTNSVRGGFEDIWQQEANDRLAEGFLVFCERSLHRAAFSYFAAS